MNKSIFKVAIALALAIACKNLPTNQSLQQNNAASTLVKSFGASITEEGGVTADQAAKMLVGVDSLPMKLIGKVTEVCQAKGCWMNVVAESGSGSPIMVKFKDYGFFVPKDCAGKKVLMDGIAFKEVTPVDELKHYAEDKGATKEEIAAITQPKEEMKFLASGVLLYEK